MFHCGIINSYHVSWSERRITNIGTIGEGLGTQSRWGDENSSRMRLFLLYQLHLFRQSLEPSQSTHCHPLILQLQITRRQRWVSRLLCSASQSDSLKVADCLSRYPSLFPLHYWYTSLPSKSPPSLSQHQLWMHHNQLTESSTLPFSHLRTSTLLLSSQPIRVSLLLLRNSRCSTIKTSSHVERED